MLRQPVIAALNHLLEQSGWALQRLAPFNGRIVRFEVFPLVLACVIGEDGALVLAGPDASADAVLTLSPALLPRLALGDESAFDAVGRTGEPSLLEEIFFLARNLRWDAAEDLSRVTGDIAAERIVGFARDARQQVHKNALNLAQALTEYWTEERPLLAKPEQLAAFGQEVTRLGTALDALEARVLRLTKAGSAKV